MRTLSRVENLTLPQGIQATLGARCWCVECSENLVVEVG